MYKQNEGLVQRHAYDSRPDDWPLLHRGINYWNRDQRQVYLLGNPIAFWGSAVIACAFLTLKGIIALREHRGWRISNPSLFKLYNGPATFLLASWLIHWVPFFSQKRQLFLHHYMPSLYFAMLILVIAFEYATVRIPKGYRYGIAAVLTTLYLYVFWQFVPITYGTKWTKAECEKVLYRSSWDINCSW
jgi:dolichyl-phosphate-mannose-protein mannosyltransferase